MEILSLLSEASKNRYYGLLSKPEDKFLNLCAFVRYINRYKWCIVLNLSFKFTSVESIRRRILYSPNLIQLRLILVSNAFQTS